MRAAIMPTGKNKSINGGGGSGGSNNGRTTMNNARPANTRTEPKLIHCTMTTYDLRRTFLSLPKRQCHWIFVWFLLGGNPVWGDGPNRPESEGQIPRYSADAFSNFYCKFDLVHF
ncbi:hypothetical protein ACE6H2_006331 [Prunus campanulata]